MVRKSFYGISIVGYFFKFWSKYEGSKIIAGAEISAYQKNKFFCQTKYNLRFQFQDVFSRLLLSKIIWCLFTPISQ